MAATLSLGVGLSAGVFSFADGYLFRGLPFPFADQLYFLRDPNARIALLASDAIALRQSDLAEFGFVQWSIASGGELIAGDRQIKVLAYEVGPGFRKTVALPLIAGRDFAPEEHQGAGPLPAWMSYRFWQREFRGDREIVGRSFRMRTYPSPIDVQIVGILSPLVTSFDLNNPPPDLVVPQRGPEEVGPNRLAFPIVRLPEGVTREQGEARIAAVLQAAAPSADGKPRAARLRPLIEYQTAGGKPTARVFFIGAMLALLLAAINLAHLLVTRGASRTDEIAVRAALGANRWRLARLFLTESLMLATIGIASGLVLGYGLSQLIASRVPVYPTAGRNLALVPTVWDWRVTTFATVLGLVVAVAGGLWPAWRALRRPLVATSRHTGGVSTTVPARLSRAMLASELLVATAVLLGACFFGLGIWRYLHQPLGFDHVDRFVVNFTPSEPRSATAAERDAVRRAVAGVPGVQAAGPRQFEYVRGVEVPGRAIDPKSVQAAVTSPGYFETWNLKLSAGRWFTPDEFRQDLPVAVVDRKFASAVWADVEPLGEEVRVGTGPVRRVIGVIEPVRTRLAVEVPGKVIVPAALPDSAGPIVAWAPGASLTGIRERMIAAVRSVVGAADVRVEAITFDDLFLRDVGEAQFQAPIMTVFGALAFVLAGVGVFGLVSFLVDQRTREFGIRMTLGAGPADIWRSVVGESLWPAMIGIVLGVAAAWSLESVVRSTVFGWQTSGLEAVSIVVIALLGIAVLSAALPARRAMRVDPATTLRSE
jgi:predicted permease